MYILTEGGKLFDVSFTIFHDVLCTFCCKHNSHSKCVTLLQFCGATQHGVMPTMRNLSRRKLERKVESGGTDLLSNCECDIVLIERSVLKN